MNSSQSARNISAMFSELWRAKWAFVCTWIIVGAGTFAATYLWPCKWKAQTEFVPEYNLQERRALQQVAWDLGIDATLNTSATVIQPIHYAGMIEDREFLRELGERPVRDSKGEVKPIIEHYNKRLKSPEQVWGHMSKMISGKLIRKENSCLITAIAEDPVVAAGVANICREQLAIHIAQNQQQVRERNLECYAELAETNQTARTLYEMSEIDAQNYWEGDDYFDIDFYYGNSKVTISTSMCVLIDYPRFTLHGTNGSMTLPPVIHNSGKKKVVGRHVVNQEPAPEERWGTLVYKDADGNNVTEKVPVDCAHYERIYENLVSAIENGAEKVVKDEEVVRVLEILEMATEVAKSHA